MGPSTSPKRRRLEPERGLEHRERLQELVCQALASCAPVPPPGAEGTINVDLGDHVADIEGMTGPIASCLATGLTAILQGILRDGGASFRANGAKISLIGLRIRTVGGDLPPTVRDGGAGTGKNLPPK